jgi:DNA-binding transcriptional LysR family regulator
LTQRRQIPLEALAGETLLLREQGSGTRTDVEAMLAQRGIEVSVMMELRSSGAIKQAVAAGLGVAVMPLGALELELLAERVAVLDVAGFPVMRSWSLARRPGRRLSAAAEALWAFLLAYRGDVVSDFPPQTTLPPRSASKA